MITIIKKEVKSCCGKTSKIWQLSSSLNKSFLPIFELNGFFHLKSFFDAGMLYIEDKNVIATGVFGLNELSIKCKNKKNCQQSVDLLESIILNIK